MATNQVERGPARTSSGARLRRGFSRLGIALGVPAAAIVGAVVAVPALALYNGLDRDFRAYACALKANGNRPIGSLGPENQFADLVPFSAEIRSCTSYRTFKTIAWVTPGKALKVDGRTIVATSDYEKAEYAALAFAGVLGSVLAAFLLVWGAFRAIGWIFAGFARD